jgi:hypothetical protein
VTRAWVLILIAAGGLAHADKPVVQLATISASSEQGGKNGRHAAFRAFDADTRTSWCPSGKDDGTLTIHFAAPVHVRSLTLYGSEHVGEPEHTLPLQVTSDTGSVEVAFGLENDQGQEVDVSPSPTQSLSFRFTAVPAKERKLACIWDIELELAEGPFIYGVSEDARAALPGALTKINEALAGCNAKLLRERVRFPFRFRETSMVFMHHRSYSGQESLVARKPSELSCNMLHDDDPLIDQGIAPGVVRVAAGAGTTTIYWEVVWKAGKWLLTGMDTVFFE